MHGTERVCQGEASLAPAPLPLPFPRNDVSPRSGTSTSAHTGKRSALQAGDGRIMLLTSGVCAPWRGSGEVGRVFSSCAALPSGVGPTHQDKVHMVRGNKNNPWRRIHQACEGNTSYPWVITAANVHLAAAHWRVRRSGPLVMSTNSSVTGWEAPETWSGFKVGTPLGMRMFVSGSH